MNYERPMLSQLQLPCALHIQEEAVLPAQGSQGRAPPAAAPTCHQADLRCPPLVLVAARVENARDNATCLKTTAMLGKAHMMDPPLIQKCCSVAVTHVCTHLPSCLRRFLEESEELACVLAFDVLLYRIPRYRLVLVWRTARPRSVSSWMDMSGQRSALSHSLQLHLRDEP